MSIYAHIKRCLELADRDIASAVGDRRLAKALLDQLAKVSRPGDGAPKLLLVFARLAGAEVDWIDGALRVEMVGDADGTLVEVLSELGLGMHERVFPSFKMSVPLEEFARAVERVPHMVAPLAIASATGRRLVLTATSDEEEEEGTPSAAVSIGDDSLYMKRGSKEKLAEAAAKALNPAESEPPPPAPVMATPRVVRKSIRPAALPPPVDEPMKAARPHVLPKPPALPRDERASEPDIAAAPAPVLGRSVVAKVPLTRIQVPRSAVAVEKRASKHPKRASMKPPPKHPSKPPERRSKAPPAKPRSTRPPPKASVAPKRSIPPKASVAPKGRARAAASVSEPPDEEGIDMGWDDSNEE
jgi:hypothetical protein